MRGGRCRPSTEYKEDFCHDAKEILLKTLDHEPTPRPAWVPFAGVHSAKLIDCTATEFLQDGDKMYQALMEVNRLYKPDG